MRPKAEISNQPAYDRNAATPDIHVLLSRLDSPSIIIIKKCLGTAVLRDYWTEAIFGAALQICENFYFAVSIPQTASGPK